VGEFSVKLIRNLAAGAVAVAALLGAAQASQAAVIDWTLTNGAFDDGGTFSGTFSFDNATDTITQWNVVTTFAPTGSNFYSSPGGCVFIFCSGASDNGSGPTFSTSIFIFGNTFELTDITMGTPGVVAVLTGDESGLTGFPFTPVAFSRTVTGGQAAGVLATPEPATWALMLGGFGLAGAALRRSHRMASAA
jgi:hypothetical protein